MSTSTLVTMSATYERVTGRQAFQYAYSPADTEADTRFVFAYSDRRFRGDSAGAEQFMRELLDEAQAEATERVYDTLRRNPDLWRETRAIRAEARHNADDDAKLGRYVLERLQRAAETFHGPTGEFGRPYGTASMGDVLDALTAAGVEVAEADVPQAADLVSAAFLGRMLRHTRHEDLGRKGYVR